MSISLSIAEPCHENWNNMLPEQQGKFCLGCQKTVTDFTNMTDAEVLRFFDGYTGNTCGRFTGDQLERKIAAPKKHSIGKWRYFWQILIPAMFAVSRGEAQMKKGEVACTSNTKQINPIMMGKVAYRTPAATPPKKWQVYIMDEMGQLVPFATIRIVGTNNMASADEMGRFDMAVYLNKTIDISSVGFETKTVDVKTMQIGETAIVLQKKTDSLQGVKVIGYGSQTISCTMGAVSVVTMGAVSAATQITHYGKKKDTVTILPEPSLKIFPNPIRASQSFKVQLSVAKLGRYMVQIVDISGHVIKEQIIDMQSLQQTENIDGAGLRQPGIYIVHLTNGEKKSVFSGKLVVE